MSDMKENLELLSRSLYRLPVAELTDEQLHAVVARAVLARLQPAWQGSLQAHCAGRRAYYFSAEYLLGKAVYNNLLCTGLTGEVETALTACGRKLDQLDCVPDPPLGNGGLGRLAACFLDSGATLNLPLDGYGLRYRCGLFRQQIEDGFQVETVEDDLQYGDPWSVCCRADTVTVEFAEFAVQAVPYDLPIPGYGTAHISTLRLWESVPIEPFDFDAFNRQDYTAAVTRRTAAENLTRVLYPNDTKEDGKRLRLRQQYFLCSASLQDLLRRYLRTPGCAPEKLGTAVVIQLNDTHPVLAIPEFIRLLLKQGMTLEAALGVAKEVFCYTNHTVMPEAMESWDLALLASELPEIARLLCQLDDLFCAEMQALGAEERLWHRVRPLRDGRIYMADLACWVCGYVNGVAALHTEILRRRVLRDWAQLYPDKILNRTNGITQRRFAAGRLELVNGVGVDLSDFQPVTREQKLALRRAYGYSPDDFILIYPADFSARKNQNMLFDTLKLLLEKDKHFRLLLPGSDVEARPFLDYAKSIGVADHVEALGYRRDIRQLVGLSDVSVSSSRQEGLPINLVEAMALGNPVVATDVRGNRDLVQDGDSGYLVPLNDSRAMADRIWSLYTDPEQTAAFGVAGRTLAQDYAVEPVLHRMIEIYQALELL